MHVRNMAVFFFLAASAAESTRQLNPEGARAAAARCNSSRKLRCLVETLPQWRFIVSKLDEEFHGLSLLNVASIANEALDQVLVPVAHGQVENLCVGTIEKGQSISVETIDCCSSSHNDNVLEHDVVAVLANHDVGAKLGRLQLVERRQRTDCSQIS